MTEHSPAAPLVFANKKPALMRKNLSAQIYEFLEDRIVAGDIVPGTKLSEVAIAREFGVSRQPVREAIARLERLGLAKRGGRDRVVARPTEQLISDTYEVWWVLDVGRTYLSSLAAADADIARLRQLLDDMETATVAKDRTRFGKCSRDFHRLIASRCTNAQLENALQGCELYVKWFRGLYLRDRQPSEARLTEHRRIIECYARKDLPGLIELVRQHVLRQRDEVLEAWRKESARLEEKEADGSRAAFSLRVAGT